jgi:4-hydroxy-4-methyl-2-oxoglutarate aldolase
VSPDLSSRLGQLDACAVSDALDALGLEGATFGIGPLWGHPRVAGRVVTVRLVEARGAQPPGRHLGTAAIEAAQPGDVIVVEHRGPAHAAGWGGILSLAASRAKVGGVIVDGACRDVDEARELEFPLFGRSATAMTARGRLREESFGEPITVGGVRVAPGDYVVADSSAVVFVGAAGADAVLERAEQIASRERQMAEAVRAGRPVSEVMGASYETMLRS